MKHSKRWSNGVSRLLATVLALLSVVAGTASVDAHDPNLAFAATPTVKQCMNTCRARYRSCLSLKQIPAAECRGVYQDCGRLTCNAVQG